MKFQYNDGGRKEAGYKGDVRDCAVRSIAITTGKLYQDVYDDINIMTRSDRLNKRIPGKPSARNGVTTGTVKKYFKSLCCTWVPTMEFGSGCQIHLRAAELPKGRLVIRVSKHFTAIIDGVLLDTYDCSRNGTRCVYGYWVVES